MAKSVQKSVKSDKNRTQFETRAVNLDIPLWMLEILDQKADSLGISRKAVINVILGQTLMSKKGTRFDLGDNLDLHGLSKIVTPEWSSDNDEEAFRDL